MYTHLLQYEYEVSFMQIPLFSLLILAHLPQLSQQYLSIRQFMPE